MVETEKFGLKLHILALTAAMLWFWKENWLRDFAIHNVKAFFDAIIIVPC